MASSNGFTRTDTCTSERSVLVTGNLRQVVSVSRLKLNRRLRRMGMGGMRRMGFGNDSLGLSTSTLFSNTGKLGTRNPKRCRLVGQRHFWRIVPCFQVSIKSLPHLALCGWFPGRALTFAAAACSAPLPASMDRCWERGQRGFTSLGEGRMP